ncbi:MAG: CHAD domain-containing protein [Burkholderiales bacterium]|nr:CHAD domain-containing protein [Burkholderiales bacterium]
MSKATKQIANKISLVTSSLSQSIDLLLANQGDDPLHNVRVSARRLGSTLSPFSKLESFASLRDLRQPIHALIKLSNQLRDAEVQAALLKPLAEGAHPEWWQHWLETRTHADHAIQIALYRHMQRPDIGRSTRLIRRACTRAIKKAGKQQLRWAIRRQGRRLKERIGDYSLHGRHLFDEAATWHALRLDCKRLRYLQEVYRSILPARDQIDPILIKAAQDALGELRDVDVLLASLAADTTPAPIVEALHKLRAERLAHAEEIVVSLMQAVETPAEGPQAA